MNPLGLKPFRHSWSEERHSTREGAFGQPGGNDAVVNVVDVVVLAPGLGR